MCTSRSKENGKTPRRSSDRFFFRLVRRGHFSRARRERYRTRAKRSFSAPLNIDAAPESSLFPAPHGENSRKKRRTTASATSSPVNKSPREKKKTYTARWFRDSKRKKNRTSLLLFENNLLEIKMYHKIIKYFFKCLKWELNWRTIGSRHRNNLFLI